MYRRLHNIEQVNADLKDSALAHMPASVLAAKWAWFFAAVMAYNLHPRRPDPRCRALRQGTGTIRRKLIHILAGIATSA